MSANRNSSPLHTFEWRTRKCFGVVLPRIEPTEVVSARRGSRAARDSLLTKLDVGVGRIVDRLAEHSVDLQPHSAEIVERTMVPIRHQIETSIGHPTDHDPEPGGIWRCLEDSSDEHIAVWAYLRTALVRNAQRAIERDPLRYHSTLGSTDKTAADPTSPLGLDDWGQVDDCEINMNQAWLGCLSQEERELIVLHYWKQMKLIDIARLKMLPDGTIRAQHHRALAKIRHYLSRAED
jgi:RNA polymerase sigma factor (sigma-70 family)